VAVSFMGGGNGVAVSFIGGGNGNKRRKPPTCNKSLTNLKNVFLLHLSCSIKYSSQCRGHDRMAVGFTTTCAII
jgi:hypothetical protein